MIALQTIQEELLVEFYDILKMIAVKYNTTVEAVYSEMQLSIDEAFQSTDPSVRQAWSRTPFCGEKPAPEELVSFLATMLTLS